MTKCAELTRIEMLLRQKGVVFKTPFEGVRCALSLLEASEADATRLQKELVAAKEKLRAGIQTNSAFG